MEEYLRQRIDCPPLGGTRMLLEEKDNIIKKQQSELNKLQIEIKKIQAERDYILSLLSDQQKSNINNIFDSTTSRITNINNIQSLVSSTNNSITNYELSQDLHDKQIEILERKYGGSLRCHRSATIIQRAYRQYKLRENFRHLCATMKTNKRLSCTFIDNNINHNQIQIQIIKPLKPCLRISKKSSLKNSEVHFPNHHLDLPSINFEHFIECTKQQETISTNRKRVCIITDKPITNNISDQVDNISDFIDGQTNKNNGLLKVQSSINDKNFYKNLTDSPIECRKLTPSVQNLSLKSSEINSEINTSPIWKRKNSSTIQSPLNETSDLLSENSNHSIVTCISPSSTISSDRDNMSLQSTSSGSNSSSLSNRNSSNYIELHQQQQQQQLLIIENQTILPEHEHKSNVQINEIYRRRCYRVGLNIFNKKPERGIRYLMAHHFIEVNAQSVARFLLSRKGLSRQMIGEYLGNLQDPFAMQVLHAFANEFDFHDMPIDVALRKFQASFRLPGEAQKIEQLMKVFGQRYHITNPSSSPSNVDTIFILAFAIIMLNTDLHSRNIKPERKMRLEQFIKNLRAIDDGEDLDINYLTGIYERIRADEFRPDTDHVTQVAKFEQTLIGKKTILTAPHRRLVCYCRLYEIYDLIKREKLTNHQREVYLFNDLLVVTKLSGKKHQQFRQAFRLSRMNIYLFETTYYQYGIRLVRKSNMNEINLILFHARNEHDRTKLCEDLKEAILEIDEIEDLRIQSELDKLHCSSNSLVDITNNNGVVSSLIDYPTNKRDRPLSRTLSNSLLDMTLTMSNHSSLPCRTSQCSLDSGMVSLANEFSPNTRIIMR
ncbi:unnamed protein product [Rotaria sp. Silwood2]|nr:unnamed protein product [Rotaria sp. Silwood2]CAF2948162.1 unnamed protein product [Rotaria sp. Silwood2]CAF3316122.1 unnamed protein product [Rotaria sp. Silwood2]CAF3966814.1 unnamed protein product [Rotaria sp. Silwood2]CAF4010424.1 unnamed protein product [Rotaria sp. Silwood2]